MRRTIFAFITMTSSAAAAAIVPSWRINQIPPFVVAAEPSLAGAFSVSLMVTMSEGSQFGVAGLNIDPGIFGGMPIDVYNTPPSQFGSNNAPIAFQSITVFPQVYYDTYVTTPRGSDAPAASITGTFSGLPGGAVFGADRFDVAWGATPPNGFTGTAELARVTFRNANYTGQTNLPTVLVPGEVRSSDQPNLAIPVPPMPFPIPEPTAAAAVVVGLMLIGRRRISQRQLRPDAA